MNDRDVAAILAILGTAWPNQQITDKAALLWMDVLGDIEAPDAMAAARVLIKREHWFPSIAQFRNEAEAQAHGRRNRNAARVGIDPARHRPVAPPTALVAAARRLLAEMKTRKHWHGGPEPCPVCGGMKETQ